MGSQATKIGQNDGATATLTAPRDNQSQAPVKMTEQQAAQQKHYGIVSQFTRALDKKSSNQSDNLAFAVFRYLVDDAIGSIKPKDRTADVIYGACVDPSRSDEVSEITDKVVGLFDGLRELALTKHNAPLRGGATPRQIAMAICRATRLESAQAVRADTLTQLVNNLPETGVK